MRTPNDVGTGIAKPSARICLVAMPIAGAIADSGGSHKLAMNKFPVLVAAALASVVVSTASAIAAAPCAPAAPVVETITKPVPVYVVNPLRLPWDIRGTTVRLAFTVDASGVPHNVRTMDGVSADAAKRLIAAVSQWRFRPEMENGKPVSARVVLPLTLTGQT